VSVALGIQQAMRMHHIVICVLFGSAVFFRISHKQHDFDKNVFEHKMCLDSLYNLCLKHFSFQEELSEI
jgi:hypothetical protein